MYRKVKPMPNEKVERNNELYQYYLDHPELTLADVGNKYGITQQAAHKIVKRIKKAVLLRLGEKEKGVRVDRAY